MCVVPVTIVDCQSMLAKPVAVPLLVKVAPDATVKVPPLGTVNVSPLSPSVKSVPDLGLILFTFTSLILY